MILPPAGFQQPIPDEPLPPRKLQLWALEQNAEYERAYPAYDEVGTIGVRDVAIISKLAWAARAGDQAGVAAALELIEFER